MSMMFSVFLAFLYFVFVIMECSCCSWRHVDVGIYSPHLKQLLEMARSMVKKQFVQNLQIK